MFGLLQIARIMRFPVPWPVLVVVLSVVLSAVFNLEEHSIAVVGHIPAGLPSLTMPRTADLPFETLALGTAAIFLVSYGSGIVTARSFGAKSGHPVDPNRELIGFGAANITAGFFGAFPVTASDGRTAVNLTVGGRSQVTSIVAAATLIATLIATLLFLEPALRIIPIPALGAVHAVTPRLLRFS
jgi:MFS superfamily sulfate permease-like transporter